MGSGRRANFTRHRRYIQSHTNLEAQGQRLSNNNPNDDDDDQSLLILFSAQRHAQPLQTKLNEMNAKCSCSKMAATELEKCLTTLERKQQTLIDDRKCKVVRSRKEKRDAATSPQLPCKETIDASKSKDVNLKICNSPARSGTVRLSPRRDIPTRNAATSPQVDSRRHATATNHSSTTSADNDSKSNEPAVAAPKMSLEKSKSLSESRPQRQLRTTRSLSPRPPIRHQQAIIISDENDVVLKVTPSEDVRYDQSVKPRKAKPKSQSEQTSPNLSDCGTFFPDERYANNRSTGCLVYVPSDPWMKMDSNDLKSERPATARSRPGNDSDPWIHRNSENQNSKSPKVSRSGSSKTDDRSNSRPAQPRSKSPAINDESTKEPKQKNSLIDSSTENLMLSPQKAHTSPTASLSPLDNPKRAKNSLLSVNNSNLLQPRHSFSSPSQKEDELQLNIRRLSEQIKSGGYSTASSGCVAPSTDFTSYLNQIKKEKTLTKGIRNSGNVVVVDADVVLETTC
ncbi:uncharacterized protein LOC119070054 isoform X1 [Bradysia coprophila]|uniref:uncharacterized protein LOC119070054 isoform X1 n=1 Tax=Bradysia coprophila TaxID=38358 RepID=UPI00187DC02F|nr:uncharacterized protein LOC119070054 isoform X1 [Bradysia coprophila]